MAEALQARAEELFAHFMAPLVLGGELRPGKLLGGRRALAIGVERTVVDADLAAHLALGRIRVARKIAPIDRIGAPTPSEWALAAILHDLVQATNPKLEGTFTRGPGARVLEIARLTIDRVPPPADVGEALSRHTLFARALDIGRADTKVSYWIGSGTYLGVDPPERLTAWPSVRRVHVDRTVTKLMTLPHANDVGVFGEALAAWLALSPLTDLASADRDLPAFSWSPSTLALVRSDVGRTLAVRALRFAAPARALDAIERATKALAERDSSLASSAIALVDEARFYERAATTRSSET